MFLCCNRINECFKVELLRIVIWLYREPRGFGFVKYRYADDAAQAKQQLNHTIIGGREIRIVFAEENRKTPQEMRRTTRTRCPSSYFSSLIWFYTSLYFSYWPCFFFQPLVAHMERAIGGGLHQDANIIVSLIFYLAFNWTCE